MFARELRFALILAWCAALFACAPMIAPRGIESEAPHIASGYFVTRDGLHLPLREWDAQNPKAIIVALHGMSDYSEAFGVFGPGPWWAEHGITTLAYDQRGFGAAPDPGVWAGAKSMRQDLDDFVDAAREKYPGVPVYAMGESMGGAVVLSSLATPDPPHVDGAILIAPAVWSREDMPFFYGWTAWFMAHMFPWMHVSGNGLHIIASDNTELLRRLARDPLFQHSARSDQVYGLLNLMDEARIAPEHLEPDPPPILFLYGKNDQVIPPGPTQAVIAALGARAEVHRDPNGYHMLLRDLDAKTVWNEVADWILKRAPSANASGRITNASHAQ